MLDVVLLDLGWHVVGVSRPVTVRNVAEGTACFCLQHCNFCQKHTHTDAINVAVNNSNIVIMVASIVKMNEFRWLVGGGHGPPLPMPSHDLYNHTRQ